MTLASSSGRPLRAASLSDWLPRCPRGASPSSPCSCLRFRGRGRRVCLSCRAASQKCRCRISLSRGRKSYSMSSRSMVSRWRRRTAVEISSAIAAVSLPPSSMACSVSSAAACAQFVFVDAVLCTTATPGVQVPAVVVDALIVDRARRAVRARRWRIVPSRCMRADDHVGNLHAGVVDVVLHVDLVPVRAQQAHEGVAENGVAQVADVRGLVGIDAGVFDKTDPGCAANSFAKAV